MLVPLVLVILALALYPQLALDRSESSVKALASPATRQARIEAAMTSTPKGPHIDWAGLSPLLALLGGATLVLLVGLLRPRAVREVARAAARARGLRAPPSAWAIWQFGEQKDLIAGALRLDDLTIVLSFVFCAGGAAAVLLSWRAVAPARGGARRVLRAAC